MGKNFLVGQSGGPSAVINASLYGVLSECLNWGSGKVYGMIHGIEGFLQGNYMDLSEIMKSRDLHLLKNTPAAYLGSCRYKLPKDLTDPCFDAIFKYIDKLDIGFMFYIGGNDSMDTVDKLGQYARNSGRDIKFIGIPKTIDNDLAHTDHTPGFGSAAKFVAATAREVVLDAAAYPSRTVTIIEVMGRNAGWLTASAALGRKFEGDNPLLVYLPENAFSTEAFLQDIEKCFDVNNCVVIAISEGLKLANGKLLCEDEQTMSDAFGHKSLSGASRILEKLIKEKFNIKARSVELSVTQRAAAKNASLTDINEAVLAGRFGVQSALAKETGKMVAFERVVSSPYSIKCVLRDVSDIANQEQIFPESWISADGKDITKDFIDYAMPLIQGEPAITYENGLPKYFYRR